MIKKEIYIDKKGKEHPELVFIYSDLGVRLYQIDTDRIYPDYVIDHISANHKYKEMVEDLGEIPEALQEKEPEIDKEPVPENLQGHEA